MADIAAPTRVSVFDAPAASSEKTWVVLEDRRPFWLLPAALLLPFLGAGLSQWTGVEAFHFTTLVVLFGFIPILERALGDDARNVPEALVPTLERMTAYRAWLYLAVATELLTFVFFVGLCASGTVSPLGLLGLTLSVGVITGISINTAHELGHKASPWLRGLSLLALAPTAYGHFLVEHNEGHHVRVATPEDPASARLFESFWRFLPRSVIGGVVSAWAIESSRLRKKGAWRIGPQNRILLGLLLTAALYAALLGWAGLEVWPYLLAQAVIGFSLLEVINYIEHYGLLRQRGPDGRYEPVKPEHSWNSNRRVTNILLFQLQRHADHHANPKRSYPVLRNFEGAPQLPTGYASLVPVALIPWWWFSMMNHRVLAHYGGEVARANRG